MKRSETRMEINQLRLSKIIARHGESSMSLNSTTKDHPASRRYCKVFRLFGAIANTNHQPNMRWLLQFTSWNPSKLLEMARELKSGRHQEAIRDWPLLLNTHSTCSPKWIKSMITSVFARIQSVLIIFFVF